MRFKSEGLDGALSKTSADLADTILQRDAVIADYARSQEDVVAITAKHDAASKELARMLTERDAALDAVEVERGTVDKLTGEALALSAARDAAIAAVTAAQEAHAAERAAAAETHRNLEMDRDTALDIAAKAEQERDAALHQMTTELDAAKGREEHLSERVEDLTASLDGACRQRDGAKAEADTIATEAETLRTDVAQARVAVAEAESRLRDVLTAQRYVFADAMGRMVRREVAKAKNYQASPNRMAAWLESFYDDTEENIFVEALLPAARLHLAWMGSEQQPADFAREIARAHFAESKRTLSTIVDAGAEGFGEMVQRTLAQWESTRAETLADKVMEQELRHGR
jgi:hypothetical protein